MYRLEKLVKNRDQILIAELAALLHDAGKLHAGHQSKYLRDQKRSNYVHTRFGPGSSKQFLQNFSTLIPKATICGLTVYPETIIREHHKRIRGDCLSSDLFTCLIQRMDWMDSEFDRVGIIWRGHQSKHIQPTSEKFGLFNVFGSEFHLYRWEDVEHTRNQQASCKNNVLDIFLRLLCLLRENFRASLSLSEEINRFLRNGYILQLRLIFLKAAGDTRFSVNDISLWEHSHSVSVLSKALIAWCELHGLSINNQNKIQDKMQKHSKFRSWFRPQLFPLRIDGLTYLSQSNNVPDLLARRKLLEQVYDTWKDILEWEFPLAGEVYRDENGPVFLTFLRDKECKDAITLKQLSLPQKNEKYGGKDKTNSVLPSAFNQAKNLEEYLRQSVIHLTQGDLTLPPKIMLPTYTQKRASKQDEKSLGDLLREEQKDGLWLHADKQCLHLAWKRLQRRSTKGEEICTICGLRPQGSGRWYVLEGTNEKKLALDEWIHHYRNNHNPKKKWEEKTEEERKCQVCKAISRGMCGVCLERREERAKPWAFGVHLSGEERFLRGLPETVWLDEIADKNGRIALIVGYFPIEHWLDGSLVESLAMFKQSRAEAPPTNRKITITDENGEAIEVVLGPKPVSYSRIRRVWETTRRFWQDVAPTEAPSKAFREWLEDNRDEFGLELRDLWEGPLSLAESLAGKVILEKEKNLRPRLFLKGSVQNGSLGPYHAYELEIQGRKVAVLWVPENATDENGQPIPYCGGFWVIENLEYLDRVYGRSFHSLVQELVGQPLKVYEPTEYGRAGETRATFTISADGDVQLVKNAYLPLIPILAEPRTFMALVPAESAFKVVKAIKTKYEREMGKVRNRLPLHLGIVYAGRKMPLRAIMDAGRRMLRQQTKPLIWEAMRSARKQINKGDALPKEFKDNKEGQFKEWYEVTLRNGNHQITWFVPALMGDGRTEDHWYPYVFLASPDEPTDRTRYYKTDLGNPWNPAHPWLVHAGELQPDDRIYFTPATVDFEFLDYNIRRFEIYYEDGKRKGTLTRPYLLDEFPVLEKIWRYLTKKQNNKPRLSSSQIFAIRNLIETKREEWFEKPEDSLTDENFKKFCKNLFINAQWNWGKPDGSKGINFDKLAEWAVRGWFTDAVYLFHHVMKESDEE